MALVVPGTAPGPPPQRQAPGTWKSDHRSRCAVAGTYRAFTTCVLRRRTIPQCIPRRHFPHLARLLESIGSHRLRGNPSSAASKRNGKRRVRGLFDRVCAFRRTGVGAPGRRDHRCRWFLVGNGRRVQFHLARSLRRTLVWARIGELCAAYVLNRPAPCLLAGQATVCPKTTCCSAQASRRLVLAVGP